MKLAPCDSGTTSPHYEPRARDLIFLLALCLGASVAIALVEGKDFNWDLRNYHLYGPWAFITGRHEIDWMAAGPQGYLNPLGGVPFYLMVMTGLDDRVAASLLAGLHSTALYITCLIAYELFPATPVRDRWPLVAASGLIAVMSPVVWGLMGNTFVDPIVAACLLASLYASLRAGVRTTQYWFASGLWYGLAVGLKPTQLVFAPAIAASVGVAAIGANRKHIARWLAGAVTGLFAAGASSAWALYRTFGSPTFPLSNGILDSNLGRLSTSSHDRFIPTSLSEFLLWPLRLLDAHSWIYIENAAPDGRFLILAALAIWAVGSRFVGHLRSRTRGLVAHRIAIESVRHRLQFWAFLATAWTSWLLVSGNGRYGLALFLLAGPAIVLLLKDFATARITAYGVVLVLCLQAFLLTVSYPHRWTQVRWSGRWFDVETAAVDQRANGYILIDVNSNSLAFPFLSARSGFFAVGGQAPLTHVPAVEQRLERFKLHWRGSLRVLIPVGIPAPIRVDKAKQDLLALHGLELEDTSTKMCSRIHIRGDHSEERESSQVLLSCPLRIRQPETNLHAERAAMGRLFDRVAAHCRLWFPASGDFSPPAPRALGWSRRYDATDVVLFSSKGFLYLSRGDFGPFDVPLGSVADWNRGKAKGPMCRPLPRHYRSATRPPVVQGQQ